MTALNFRKNMKNLAHLTAKGLIKAGDVIGDVKIPTKGNIQYTADNLRRNIANTINPDKWSFSSSPSSPSSQWVGRM